MDKNKRQTQANSPQSAQAPSSPTEGLERATGLGQSLAIKIFPIWALSWPIRIVNEGSVGRVALCSCPAQPALGNCYFSQVINPIIPPPLYSAILSAEDAEKRGLQPGLFSHRGEGKGFPQEHFVPGFNGFLKPSIIYRSSAPPPTSGPEEGWIYNHRSQEPQNFTKVQKRPFPKELHQRQSRNSRGTQIKGPTCQGLRDTKK